MIEKYFKTIEEIGTLKMLAIMAGYFFIMLVMVYCYRILIIDTQYISANDLTQKYLDNDKVSSLE